MEEPDVEIFINPIVAKQYESDENWGIIRRKVLMPRSVLAAFRHESAMDAGGGEEKHSAVGGSLVGGNFPTGKRLSRSPRSEVEMVRRKGKSFHSSSSASSSGSSSSGSSSSGSSGSSGSSDSSDSSDSSSSGSDFDSNDGSASSSDSDDDREATSNS